MPEFSVLPPFFLFCLLPPVEYFMLTAVVVQAAEKPRCSQIKQKLNY